MQWALHIHQPHPLWMQVEQQPVALQGTRGMGGAAWIEEQEDDSMLGQEQTA